MWPIGIGSIFGGILLTRTLIIGSTLGLSLGLVGKYYTKEMSLLMDEYWSVFKDWYYEK